MHDAEFDTLPEVADSDPAWQEVKRWPELRGEHKNAWKYLWRKVRFRADDTWVSFCELAHDQGRSERSARRWTKQLARHGLIGIMDDTLPGRLRVDVRNPLEVICRDATHRSGDANRPLIVATVQVGPGATVVPPGAPPGASQTAQPTAADVAPHPPAVMAPHPPTTHAPPLARAAPLTLEGKGKGNTNLDLSSFGSASKADAKAQGEADAVIQTPEPATAAPTADPELAALLRLESECRRRAEAQLAAREPDVARLSVDRAVAKARDRFVAKIPGDKERALVVEAIVERIRKRVNDATLQDSPMRRCARAVVDGSLPEDKLEDILRYVDEQRKAGKLQDTASRCFVGTAQKNFARLGIEWPKPPPKRPKP